MILGPLVTIRFIDQKTSVSSTFKLTPLSLTSLLVLILVYDCLSVLMRLPSSPSLLSEIVFLDCIRPPSVPPL